MTTPAKYSTIKWKDTTCGAIVNSIHKHYHQVFFCVRERHSRPPPCRQQCSYMSTILEICIARKLEASRKCEGVRRKFSKKRYFYILRDFIQKLRKIIYIFCSRFIFLPFNFFGLVAITCPVSIDV